MFSNNDDLLNPPGKPAKGADVFLDNYKKFMEQKRNNEQDEATKLLNAQRAKERASALAELMKKTKVVDPHSGRETTLWDLADQAIHKALTSEELMSYNDFRAAIMSLMHIYGLLVDAIQQSEDELLMQGLHELEEALFPKLDALRKHFESGSELELPALKYDVSVSDTHQLQVRPLERVDDVDILSDDLNQIFNKMVTDWLKVQGYEPRADVDDKSQLFNKKDGTRLDKATFDALKDDPDNGLDRHIRNFTEVEVTPIPVMA